MQVFLYNVSVMVSVIAATATGFTLWRYRRDRNHEALAARMVAAIVLLAWVRTAIGLGYTLTATSVVAASTLTVVTMWLFTADTRRHLIPTRLTRQEG